MKRQPESAVIDDAALMAGPGVAHGTALREAYLAGRSDQAFIDQLYDQEAPEQEQFYAEPEPKRRQVALPPTSYKPPRTKRGHGGGKPHSKNSLRNRALTVGAVGMLVASVAEWASEQDALPKHDGCTNAGQELVEVGDTSHFLGLSKDVLRRFNDDDRSWSSIATKVSSDRGYNISSVRLEQANTRFLTLSKSGKPEDAIKARGALCLQLPGMVPSGFVEANGQETVGQFASENLLTLTQLSVMNPGLSEKPTSIPKPGSIIKVSSSFDPSMVLRTMDASNINAMSNHNVGLRKQIIDANAATIGNGNGVTQGNVAYLPFMQTPYDKKHGITVADITSTYIGNYQHPNIEQNAMPNPNEAVPTDYKLNQAQLNIIDSLGLSAHNKEFLLEMVPAVMSRIEGGDRMNPLVVLSQSMLEAGDGHGTWAASELAWKYKNLFGIKADASWNGAKVLMPTMEWDGSKYVHVQSYFRVYKDYGEAIDDYALFIGNVPFYKDAMACDQDAASYLKALEGLLDHMTCKSIGNEPHYATDPTYVQQNLGLIKQFKLADIITAGKPVTVHRGS